MDSKLPYSKLADSKLADSKLATSLDISLIDVTPDLQHRVERIAQQHVPGFTEALGIRFTKIHFGRITAELTIGPQHLQPFGIAHGGVSASLAESLASFGSWVMGDEESNALGTHLSMDYISPVYPGILRGEASLTSRSGKGFLWNIELWGVCLPPTAGEEVTDRGRDSLTEWKLSSVGRCHVLVLPANRNPVIE